MAEINTSKVLNGVTQSGINNSEMRYASLRPSFTVNGSPTPEVTIEQIVVERSVIFFKRGYFPTSSQFEFWQTSDPEGINPSGNALIDITVISSSDGS